MGNLLALNKLWLILGGASLIGATLCAFGILRTALGMLLSTRRALRSLALNCQTAHELGWYDELSRKSDSFSGDACRFALLLVLPVTLVVNAYISAWSGALVTALLVAWPLGVLAFNVAHRIVRRADDELSALRRRARENHEWDACYCVRCGAKRNLEHRWDGCKCAMCGVTRDLEHRWDGCKCAVCGVTRNEEHRWDGCECAVCGEARNEEHKWGGCKCVRCGTKRNSEHQWEGCKCAVCDETRAHQWDGCTCAVCGETRDEEHNWDGPACVKCGRDRYAEKTVAQCAGRLLPPLSYDASLDEVKTEAAADAAMMTALHTLLWLECDAAEDCLRAWRILRALTDTPELALRHLPDADQTAPNAPAVLGRPANLQDATEAERRWLKALAAVARGRWASVQSDLVSSSPGRRLAACANAALCLDARAIPALVEILENDTALGLRSQAARVLGIIGHPDALPALRRALRQQEPEWRGTIMFGRLTPHPDTVQKAIDRIAQGEAQRLIGGD